jgi:gamma-glutamyl hydrolase
MPKVQNLKFPASGADLNKQPVIGILAQTLEPEMQVDPRFQNYTYYVMSSFVKFLQGAGARLVPLVPNMSQEDTLAALKKLNGVFWPGGDGDYLEYARYIYGKVIELND